MKYLISILLGVVLIALESDLPLLQPIKQTDCLLYTSPSPRDSWASRMPSSAWKKISRIYNKQKGCDPGQETLFGYLERILASFICMLYKLMIDELKTSNWNERLPLRFQYFFIKRTTFRSKGVTWYFLGYSVCLANNQPITTCYVYEYVRESKMSLSIRKMNNWNF